MDIEFKKKIEERMQELPPALAEAIRRSNWEKLVFDIGREHSLHVDDIGEIQNELILVLTGIVHPDTFREVMIEEIGIKAEKADTIIGEINEKINERIKAELRRSLEEDEQAARADEEKTVLHKAGVSFGDEVETVTTIAPPPAAEPVASVAKTTSKPKPAPAPMPNVFETKTTKISAEGKPEGFFDPYREAIE